MKNRERVIKQYNLKNLDSLRINLQTAINNNIQAIIVGNAHRLDLDAGTWTHLQMHYIQPKEFARVLGVLFRRHLNIQLDTDVHADAEATDAYQLTRGMWSLLADWVDAIDVTTGEVGSNRVS